MVMRAPDRAVIVVQFQQDGGQTHRRIAADGSVSTQTQPGPSTRPGAAGSR